MFLAGLSPTHTVYRSICRFYLLTIQYIYIPSTVLLAFTTPPTASTCLPTNPDQILKRRLHLAPSFSSIPRRVSREAGHASAGVMNQIVWMTMGADVEEIIEPQLPYATIDIHNSSGEECIDSCPIIFPICR